MSRIVFVDNRDSFTYNLVDELRVLGHAVEVWRNDRSAEALLERALPDGMLVLSPGPGAPADAGCLLALVARAAGRVPLLGICLGHQALVQALGGRVGPAPSPRHGQASAVHHRGHALFDGVPSPFSAGRYHSLAALSLPPSLDAIAHTGDDRAHERVVMAVAGSAMLGLQFHPESILTPCGRHLLSNAIAWLAAAQLTQVAA